MVVSDEDLASFVDISMVIVSFGNLLKMWSMAGGGVPVGVKRRGMRLVGFLMWISMPVYIGSPGFLLFVVQWVGPMSPDFYLGWLRRSSGLPVTAEAADWWWFFSFVSVMDIRNKTDCFHFLTLPNQVLSYETVFDLVGFSPMLFSFCFVAIVVSSSGLVVFRRLSGSVSG